VYYSSDEGLTWSRLTSDDFHLALVSDVGVDPRHPGRVYVSLRGRSVVVWD